MNEYVGADALHPPAMSRFYRDDVGIVPYKKMHNLPNKSPIYQMMLTFSEGCNYTKRLPQYLTLLRQPFFNIYS